MLYIQTHIHKFHKKSVKQPVNSITMRLCKYYIKQLYVKNMVGRDLFFFRISLTMEVSELVGTATYPTIPFLSCFLSTT